MIYKDYYRKHFTIQSGFTLIEILLSMGLLAGLASIVLVAVNPARQFAHMRNTNRMSDISGILNAFGQRVAEYRGELDCPTAVIPVVDPVPSPLTPDTGAAISSTQIDLRPCLAPAYISELPIDPTSGVSVQGTAYDTGYRMFQDQGGRVTVFAPTVEPTIGGNLLSLTR